MNAATILGGPALVKYRGATFYSKGDIVLTPTKQTFPIEIDRFGKVDERVSDEELKVTFEPSGQWQNLGVLWPYPATLLGSLIAPESQAVTAIDTGTDALTVTAHGFTTEDDILVHMATGGTIPSGLSSSTRYYVRAVDVDTLTLHPTAADATANTNTVNITDSGTGTLYVDRDYALVIHTFAGVKLTLFNAAITGMPNILLSTTRTLIGAVEFEAFLRNGSEWSDTAARWAIESEALSDTSFDPANILTQPYTLAWGSAPWDALQTKEGVEIAFNIGLDPVMTDSLGTVTRRLTSLEAVARAQPVGISESQLLTKLTLQGAGAARGTSLSGDDLNVSGTGVYVRIYGAALRTGPQQFGSQSDRVGTLEWAATRTFTAGVPDPLFYVGTAAPA